MKKYLLLTTVVLCLLAISASAQIEKGSLFLGGTIAVSSEKQEQTNNPNQENKGFVFNPAIGTAIRTNLILGIDLAYGEMTEKYNNGPDRKTHLYGGGVFLRKYYPIGRNIYLYGQGRLGYTTSGYKYAITTPSYTQEAHENAIKLNLTPGITYGINNKFFLELGLNDLLLVQYIDSESTSTGSPNPSYTTKRKSFGLSSSLANSSSFTIGARFIIPKRKAATGS